MKRDFSEEARQELLELVTEVENEKWCDFTDWIGDKWYEFQELIGSLNIKNYIDDVNSYHKRIIDKNNTTESQINSIFENVYFICSSYEYKAKTILDDMKSYSGMLSCLCETINSSAGMFNSTYIETDLKGKITEYIAQSKQMQKMVVSGLPDENPAFDDIGAYGGNQGSAMNIYYDEEIQKIVRKHYPDYSDKEIKVLLQEMNSEGCGYVALCNTIFASFVGREKEFEEIFGFPMYKDGDLNFDALIIDLYCEKDNKDHKGTNQYSREILWESYLKDKGVEVRVECDIDLTTDNYYQMVKDGQIIIAIQPCVLEDKEGNIVFNVEGGHAMTITGVTDDGRYIVSSWGKKYYVNPSADFERIQFQQVIYE